LIFRDAKLSWIKHLTIWAINVIINYLFTYFFLQYFLGLLSAAVC